MSDFFAPYRSLELPARIFAMACGVIYPHAPTTTQLATMLRKAGFRDRDRRRIHYQRYKTSVDDLVAAGIIYETEDRKKLIASETWAPWLTLQAFRDGKLPTIEQAHREEFPPYWNRMEYAESVMKLRCHTVAGRFNEIDRELGDIEEEEWRWLARPGVTHLLAELPEKYAGGAFSGCLNEVVGTAAPPEAILDAYDKCGAARARYAAGIAFIHVLRGAHKDALAVFDGLPEDLRESKPALVGLASTRALLATLQGDDAGAARYIDEALAAEKAGTRKRNLFPRCSAFTLSLLSLVRDHTPENAAKLDHLLKVGKKFGRDPVFLGGVSRAVHIRSGSSPYWSRAQAALTLDLLFEGLSACWANEFPEDDPGERFKTLLHFGAGATANGYRWLAMECLEVYRRWWRANGRSERELAELIGFKDKTTVPAELTARIHGELGTTTLASLVTPVPGWEYALRGIEQVAYEAQKKKPRRKKAAAGAQRRLAWTVEVDENGGFAGAPREQHVLKSGKWSKGRPVSLKRLQSQAGTMTFLIDQDRAAAREIVHNTYRWSNLPPYYLPVAGICQLVGHPYVFNEFGDPVEMVARDPELVLQEEEGILRAHVEPHVEEATTESYNILTASDVLWEVTRFTPGHKKLCAVIPTRGLELPADARERLLEAVSALAGEIRVQGVIGDGAEVARQVDGDAGPWVRLEPSGPGLAVALLVEPAPDSGAYFQPGIGGTASFATVNGQAVQASRDLDAEARAALELMSACPMLSAAGPDWTLTLPDPADCLELVDQLDAAGARCLWPKGQPFRVVARADARSLRLSVKSAADWFSASGTLAVDEERAIDLRNLFELIDQSPASRFVPLGDGAFVSLTASFQRQLADLRSVSALSGKKRIRLHGMAALTLRDFLDSTQLTADGGWRTQRRKFREAGSFEPRIPGTLQAELRPYQEEGFGWLARLSRWGAGACLADDMGLGKTVQTLAVLLERAADGPALVVAPTSVVANWLDEARRFAPTLKVRAYTGPAASRARRLEGLGPFDLVVTTYGLLHNDIEALAAAGWSTAVLDEAQAIKNPATKRARAARKLGARFRVVTTGTPIQNNVVDLYSLFSFLNPGMLGSMKRFRENFALPIERDRDPAARARLRRLIAPFVLRRIKADVLDDLPPRTDVTLHVEMSPREAALYEALRQRAVQDLEALARKESEPEFGEHRLQVLAHLTRLRLACCNPRLVQGEEGPPSSKLETFATTLDELRQSRHKVLVFSQFVRHLKLIEEHLVECGIPYQYLDGSTPAKVRTERIAAFQGGDGDAFLISLKAGGVGLNLTAADYVIHMDPWWNPAAEDQASDRAHRIGQTRPVTVYRLVTKGTIEEQIVRLHHRKRELADRLLEGADTPARLSTEELLGLLRG